MTRAEREQMGIAVLEQLEHDLFLQNKGKPTMGIGVLYLTGEAIIPSATKPEPDSWAERHAPVLTEMAAQAARSEFIHAALESHHVSG